MSITSIAPVINASGCTIPTFEQILTYLQGQYRGIYGADVYLGNDSQDGQFLGILATAQHDTNMAILADYNSRSPSTAQGEALSSVVKINGIRRRSSSYSTADVVIVGRAGTTITGGIVSDGVYKWALPSTVVIPNTGTIAVTATCTSIGAIAATSGTITRILTPTRGWQTVNNPAAASPGAAVETDPELRRQQAISTALTGNAILDGIIGQVANVSGVTRLAGYENDTNTTNGLGIPPHSICMVVEGGDAAAIARAISVKKTGGTGTYGDVNESVLRANGSTQLIAFFRPTPAVITVAISITTKSGYSSAVAAQIQQEVADFINAVGIGQDVEYGAVWVPARLNNSTLAATYKINSLTLRKNGGSPVSADIGINFNEVATCAVSGVVIS